MKRPWHPDELTLLRECYADTPTAEIARRLGRTPGSVYQAAAGMGIKKAEAYVSMHCRPPSEATLANRFRPGHATWNKGKAHSPAGSERGRFQVGNMPHSWKPIGTERIDKDGILVRKVSDTRNKKTDWRPVHVLLYEQHNGPAPDGHVVIFNDGNHKNFDPANLIALDRAALMKRNSYLNYPPEIARVMHLRGVLNRHINKRAKHEQDH